MLLNGGVGEDLRVPWTARRSNQSILKEISFEYSFERLMPKLKLWYLMRRMDSFEKTLMQGMNDWRWKEKGMTEDEVVGWHHRHDGHELSKLWELVMDRETWRAAAGGATKSQTQRSDWTELIFIPIGRTMQFIWTKLWIMCALRLLFNIFLLTSFFFLTYEKKFFCYHELRHH